MAQYELHSSPSFPGKRYLVLDAVPNGSTRGTLYCEYTDGSEPTSDLLGHTDAPSEHGQLLDLLSRNNMWLDKEVDDRLFAGKFDLDTGYNGNPDDTLKVQVSNWSSQTRATWKAFRRHSGVAFWTQENTGHHRCHVALHQALTAFDHMGVPMTHTPVDLGD